MNITSGFLPTDYLRIIQANNLDSGKHSILSALLTYADEFGYGFPRQTEIAESARMSRPKCSQHMVEMEEMGILKRVLVGKIKHFVIDFNALMPFITKDEVKYLITARLTLLKIVLEQHTISDIATYLSSRIRQSFSEDGCYGYLLNWLRDLMGLFKKGVQRVTVGNTSHVPEGNTITDLTKTDPKETIAPTPNGAPSVAKKLLNKIVGAFTMAKTKDELLAHLKQQTEDKKNKYTPNTIPGRFERLYKSVLASKHNQTGVRSLTMAEKANLKRIPGWLNIPSDQNYENALAHVLDNWAGFRQHCEKHEGLSSSPAIPTVGFIVKMCRHLMTFANPSKSNAINCKPEGSKPKMAHDL